MENIEKLLTEARKSIGEYCINECGAYCCSKGFLVLSIDECKFMMSTEKENLIKKGYLSELEDSTWAFELKGGCPQLKNSMCMIHKDSRRSPTCTRFPIFPRENKVIHFSSRCPAVRDNKFYGVIHELIRLGYTID